MTEVLRPDDVLFAEGYEAAQNNQALGHVWPQAKQDGWRVARRDHHHLWPEDEAKMIRKIS